MIKTRIQLTEISGSFLRQPCIIYVILLGTHLNWCSLWHCLLSLTITNRHDNCYYKRIFCESQEAYGLERRYDRKLIDILTCKLIAKQFEWLNVRVGLKSRGSIPHSLSLDQEFFRPRESTILGISSNMTHGIDSVTPLCYSCAALVKISIEPGTPIHFNGFATRLINALMQIGVLIYNQTVLTQKI